MRSTRVGIALIAIFNMAGLSALAQQAPAAIQKVLEQQQQDWNRGDVVAFMRGYKDSPDTTFIGKTIQHGYDAILARYKKAYADREAMGTLNFSDIQIRMLGEDYAAVTGRYHLVRNATAGGDASGLYSLIWQKTSVGWKIILDHSSSD